MLSNTYFGRSNHLFRNTLIGVDTLLRFLLEDAGQTDSELDQQLVTAGFNAQPGPLRNRYLSSLAVSQGYCRQGELLRSPTAHLLG